jgi:hypothetical protein
MVMELFARFRNTVSYENQETVEKLKQRFYKLVDTSVNKLYLSKLEKQLCDFNPKLVHAVFSEIEDHFFEVLRNSSRKKSIIKQLKSGKFHYTAGEVRTEMISCFYAFYFQDFSQLCESIVLKLMLESEFIELDSDDVLIIIDCLIKENYLQVEENYSTQKHGISLLRPKTKFSL